MGGSVGSIVGSVAAPIVGGLAGSAFGPRPQDFIPTGTIITGQSNPLFRSSVTDGQLNVTPTVAAQPFLVPQPLQFAEFAPRQDFPQVATGFVVPGVDSSVTETFQNEAGQVLNRLREGEVLQRAELEELRQRYASGIGAVSQAVDAQFAREQAATVSDIRGGLARRRVLGPLADRQVASAAAEFANRRATAMAQAALEEEAITERILAQQFQNLQTTAAAELEQLQRNLAADFERAEQNRQAKVAEIQAELESARLRGDFARVQQLEDQFRTTTSDARELAQADQFQRTFNNLVEFGRLSQQIASNLSQSGLAGQQLGTDAALLAQRGIGTAVGRATEGVGNILSQPGQTPPIITTSGASPAFRTPIGSLSSLTPAPSFPISFRSFG